MTFDLQSLESAARDSLAERYGHQLSDEEWAKAKAALLDFERLISGWNTQGAGSASSVVTIR